MNVVQFAVPLSKDSIVIEEDVLPYFYNYFHRHGEMQITLIVKGEGNLIIDNYTQRFSAGEVYFIAANQPHIFQSDPSYFEDTIKNKVHAIHLYFDSETLLSSFVSLPELGQIMHFIENVNYGIQIPQENSAEVIAVVQKMVALSGVPRLLKFIELLHYLSIDLKEFKSLSSGNSRKVIGGKESLRMDKIYKFTLSNYAKDISLDMVAEICHMTPQAFCKYFKKHTSKTYITFLHEIRINAACDKIIKGEIDGISSVAFATGFNSAINFNKVFKKFTGVAPRDYLKKYKVQQLA
ncbi:AraC family transcriptional regulator [Pedobacter sp. MR2016-24]|uniref:AraC family transcriptional regulator n=1 Tax=Pedobacter sp. MR2016-24 TaxID=2994466 RepID=UPI0022485C89|nr:AraC family transcriptional regulator [Pedobacter sp. MR2016-24]MCX2486430.1 AraC family transcriptional regulator [Pedobacter sp. MR2016-24]